MMTPAQRSTYWRMWTAACRRAGWDKSDQAARLEMHRQVIGEGKSSGELNNNEVTRIFRYLGAIISGNNLKDHAAAARHQEEGDLAERESLLHQIARLQDDIAIIHQKARTAYVEAVCRDIYDGREPRTLLPHQMTDLRNLLSNRLSRLISQMKMGEARNVCGYDLSKSNKAIIARVIGRKVSARQAEEEKRTLPLVKDGPVTYTLKGARGEKAATAAARTLGPGMVGFLARVGGRRAA